MLEEQLHPKLVDLSAAGASYSLDVGSHSLSVSFSGFKENLPAMIKMVSEEIQNGVDITEEDRFLRIVESVKEELDDKSEMPVQYAIQDRAILLMQGTHGDDELHGAANVLKLEMMKNPPIAGLESEPSQFTTLTMGNIGPEETMRQTDVFKAMMGFNLTLTPGEVQVVTPVMHPKVPLELRKLNPRTGDPNHVTVVSILAGVPDVIDSVTWSIIGQILSPVAYDELRTRKQLGYVVSGGVGKMSNVLVLSVVVQGKEMMPDETEAAIEMVLTKLMPERLANLTSEEFESYKEATAKAFLKPPLGFSDEVNNYWPSVAAHGICFEKRHDELEYLRTQLTSKKQLLDAYMNVVMPKLGVRSRVVVKYWSQDVGEGGIPQPSKRRKKAFMIEAGVPKEGIALIEKEAKQIKFFNKADSSVRSKLTPLYGHFTEELKCRQSTAQKTQAMDEAQEEKEEEATAGAESTAQETESEDVETDSARVAVGNSDAAQVAIQQAPPGSTPVRNRKKRPDSAFVIDHGARLSVDEVPDAVLRAED